MRLYVGLRLLVGRRLLLLRQHLPLLLWGLHGRCLVIRLSPLFVVTVVALGGLGRAGRSCWKTARDSGCSSSSASVFVRLSGCSVPRAASRCALGTVTATPAASCAATSSRLNGSSQPVSTCTKT